MQTVVLDASNNDEKMQTKVFHCLGSWLILDVIPQQHLMASKLLSSVFSALVTKFVAVEWLLGYSKIKQGVQLWLYFNAFRKSDL